MIEVENEAGMKNRVGGIVESLRKLYFLVVVKGKIQIHYGWRVARAITASGQRSTGLISNHRITEGGNITPPGLWVLTILISAEFNAIALPFTIS